MECLREMGEFTEGRACIEEAVRIAEAAGTLAAAHAAPEAWLSILASRGSPTCPAVLEHVLAQCHAAHVPLYVPGSTASLGLAYALSGRSAEALALLAQVQIGKRPAWQAVLQCSDWAKPTSRSAV